MKPAECLTNMVVSTPLVLVADLALASAATPITSKSVHSSAKTLTELLLVFYSMTVNHAMFLICCRSFCRNGWTIDNTYFHIFTYMQLCKAAPEQHKTHRTPITRFPMNYPSAIARRSPLRPAVCCWLLTGIRCFFNLLGDSAYRRTRPYKEIPNPSFGSGL